MELAPSTLAQWVGGIATSLAVAVALLKDEYLRWRRQPKLTVRMAAEPPDCIQTLIQVSANRMPLWTGDAYWLRLWVENSGTFRAEQVQVFASRLSKRDARGEFTQVADFIPMNLRWSNSQDPRNPEIFAPGISQKMGKHCDLCSISDPANPTDKLEGYEGQCVATLQLEVYPNNNQHRLPPADYRIELRVGAANANPVTVYVDVNLTGQWSADPRVMFRDCIGIKISPGQIL